MLVSVAYSSLPHGRRVMKISGLFMPAHMVDGGAKSSIRVEVAFLSLLET